MWIFADLPLAAYYCTSNILSPGKQKRLTIKERYLWLPMLGGKKSESIHCEWYYAKIMFRNQLLYSNGFKPVIEHLNI